MSVLLINGPNLNLLGTREPDVYGSTTLTEVEAALTVQAAEAGLEVDCFQSNSEGEIIDRIHAARTDGTAFIIINPGAFTHTSIAILDAVKAVGIPTVEVHISDPDAREEFRKVSYIRAACVASIKGHGLEGYLEALRLLRQLQKPVFKK